MVIHQTNYEEYVLDYLEGDLDVPTRKAMEQFFKKHPTIWEEVNDVHHFTIPKNDVIYANKEALLRNESIFPIWTYGVAAALVGLLAVVGMKFVNFDTQESSISTEIIAEQTLNQEELNTTELDEVEDIKDVDKIDEVFQTKPVDQKQIPKKQVVTPVNKQQKRSLPAKTQVAQLNKINETLIKPKSVKTTIVLPEIKSRNIIQSNETRIASIQQKPIDMASTKDVDMHVSTERLNVQYDVGHNHDHNHDTFEKHEHALAQLEKQNTFVGAVDNSGSSYNSTITSFNNSDDKTTVTTFTDVRTVVPEGYMVESFPTKLETKLETRKEKQKENKPNLIDKGGAFLGSLLGITDETTEELPNLLVPKAFGIGQDRTNGNTEQTN